MTLAVVGNTITFLTDYSYRVPAKELNSPPFPRGPLYRCPCRNLTSSGLSPQPWHSDSGKESISVSFLISIRVSLHVLLTLFAFFGSLSAIGLFIHSRHTTFILWWQLCLFATTTLSRSQSICLPFSFISLPQQPSLDLSQSVSLSALMSLPQQPSLDLQSICLPFSLFLCLNKPL